MTATIYILLPLCLTALIETRDRYSTLSSGRLTINHGQNNHQFKLFYLYYYFQGETENRNSDYDWVIIEDQNNFNPNLGSSKLGQFSFEFDGGAQEHYTTRFELADTRTTMMQRQEKVKEITNLRFLQCSLTFYEFFVITASFFKRDTLEVIESNIKTDDMESYKFSSDIDLPFDKVRQLTVKDGNSQNDGKALGKILEVLPKLMSLKVIGNSYGEIFREKKIWMDNLQRLHLERVKLEPHVFFDILSNCNSLRVFTLITVTFSGLNEYCTGDRYREHVKHHLTVYLDKEEMKKEDLNALNKLVGEVKDLKEIV